MSMRDSDSAFEEILAFTLALGRLPGIGARTVQRILREKKVAIKSANTFDTDFLSGLENERIDKALDKSTTSWDELVSQSQAALAMAQSKEITPLHPYMPQYPSRLLENGNYPPVLFCKGDTTALNAEKSVAMVGTRRPTDFGARMGRRLAELLARNGYSIVSGLALGCDTAAHIGALSAGGKTIAVLPTPLDAPVYPKENTELAWRILESGGTLVSEYLPGTRPDGRQLVANLVARDEWQTALADGLVVFETSLDGGSKHAFEHARKSGKPVAVFDYREKAGREFLEDPRFSGNAEWLMLRGVSPIFSRDSIELFERRMESWRLREKAQDEAGGQTEQLAISTGDLSQ